ncbi:ventricular zone-expressed PH domain-containing protein homolog 1-like [Gigantopelta aegis]|uniref:ventricular zone-expressed PH domain-containing protein homolog 1-like n=1 Tax=Gigantopelta aegis TaxID=1735272 RepID=UPI001B88C006|nr:ventricular zone-expressed PH domain-containing protein homolog 1-like [Gigantopelta aegis]
MHELFAEVLTRKDLSKAGDLFSLEDVAIEKDLSDVVEKICQIVDTADYEINDNDQSVVEICITRLTTAIRETNSVEKHASALVGLLEVCQRHNLTQSKKDEDPPHVKIASDIMSCLFMYYNKGEVMKLAIPAAVKFLNSDNADLSRNVSSYLSLAAIDNADFLVIHIPLLVTSILKGNYLLSQVMPQIYVQNTDPVDSEVDNFVSLLTKCDVTERICFIQLLGCVAKRKPTILEPHIPVLSQYLQSSMFGPLVLSIFVNMATANPAAFVDHLDPIKKTVETQPMLMPLVAQIVGAVGTVNKTEAKNSMDYLVSQLSCKEQTTLPLILSEIRALGLTNNVLLLERFEEIIKLSSSGSSAVRLIIQQIKEDLHKYAGDREMKSVSSQTEGTITVITVGNPPNATHPSGTVSVKTTMLPSAGTSSQQSLSKSSRASSLTAGLPSDRASSPASTLVSEKLSVNSGFAHLGSTHLHEPIRDGVQHFYERHLSSVKDYIASLNIRLPLPAKCCVVNGRHKNFMRLFFQCSCQTDACLYSSSYFTVNTKLPKTWIYLMFLSVQAQSTCALSQQDSNVSCLKACWDALHYDRGNSSFLTLVTSLFPTAKDQDTMLQELHSVRYFDIFEFSATQKSWVCFVCNHPEKLSPLLQDGLPNIAGQLKEKKGKWKFLKRWKTRYFTLSGGSITYSKSNLFKEMLPVSQIQSIKAVKKGIRDIPKAFEIFTADQTYVFKAKSNQNVEQWVQCLHIAVARSKNGNDAAAKPSTVVLNRPRSAIMSDTKL